MAEPGSARRWRTAAGGAMALVADRPDLWLAGALAWVGGIGWLPFFLAVARPPSQAELTYLGAGIQSSGLWPLNLIGLAAAAVGVVVAAVALGALGNAALDAALVGRALEAEDVGRRFVAAMMAVAPIALAGFVILVGIIAVAPTEFTRPGVEDAPAVRVVARLAPLIVLSVIVAAVAATLADLAGRLAVRAGDVATGIAGVPRAIRGAGAAGAIHGLVSGGAGLVLLAGATLLLRVLWAPIGTNLAAGDPLDARVAALLVGFVGIWLCLVLAGGALHAWASATWISLVGPSRRERRAAATPMEAGIDR